MLPRQRSGRSFQVCPGVADLAGYGEGYWFVDHSILTSSSLYEYAYYLNHIHSAWMITPSLPTAMHTTSLLPILDLYLESDYKSYE